MIIIEKYGMNEEQADMVRVADLHTFCGHVLFDAPF